MKKNSLVEQLSRIHSLMGTKKVLSEGKWFNLASEFLSDLISKAQRVGDEVIVNGVKISKKTWDDLVTAIDNPSLFDALSDAEKRLLAKAAQSDTKVVDEIYKSFLTTLINKAKAEGRELSEESIIKLVNRDLDANPGKTTYESILELTVDETGKTDPFVSQLLSKKISKKIMEVESNTFTPEIKISKVVDDVITPSGVIKPTLFSFANKIAMNLPDKIEGFITGKNANTVRNLLNSIKSGTKETLTEDEFKLIIDNVSRKDLADAFTQQFGTELELEKVTNQLLDLLETSKSGRLYESYTQTLEQLRDRIYRTTPSLDGSYEWLERFLGEIEYKFANEFKTKLGQRNNKILKDFVQQETEYISKNITKETLLDIAYWDGRLFEISDAERDFILKNSDKNLIAKVKSNFVNRTADIDRVLKLIKTFTNTTDTAAKIRITTKLKTELEQLTAKNINDIQLIMNYLEQLKNSKFITKEEKDALENLLNTLQTNSSIIKKWGSTTAIYEEKSAVSKLLNMLWIGIKDSFDTLNVSTLGTLDLGFREIPGKTGWQRWSFSLNMSKKLKDELGLDVLQGNELFANSFLFGSARGFPKLNNLGAQEIFEEFGNINYLRGVYVTTLVMKVIKGSAVSSFLLALMEGAVYLFNYKPVMACNKAMEKIVGDAKSSGIREIEINETNMPPECNRTSIFYAVAWDFSTNPDKNGVVEFKVDPKFLDEMGENFNDELNKGFWTWLIHINGAVELGYHFASLILYLDEKTSDKSIEEMEQWTKDFVDEKYNKPAREAQDKIVKIGEEWKSKGDSLMTKTKQEADTLKSEIKNVLDSTTYFNQAERDSVVAAMQNAKDNVIDAVTTLTFDSFKKEFHCLWSGGKLDTSKGTEGVEIINNETVVLWWKGGRRLVINKIGNEWYYFNDKNTPFGKCQ